MIFCPTVPGLIVRVLLPVNVPLKSISLAIKDRELLPAVTVELKAIVPPPAFKAIFPVAVTVELKAIVPPPAFKAIFPVVVTGALKLILPLVVKLPEIETAPAPV